MHAVATNQIADILYFNDRVSYKENFHGKNMQKMYTKNYFQTTT